ncbi:MAG: CDP-alcohol phosphatidyltransferase family protein [Nitrospirota bacterium]|nr:MAG: CDP-alcohol phosphatidyltransferase family protein [Nitrospirota bacterium]
MDGTLKKPVTSVVDTAILLASSGVFTLGAKEKEPGPGALTRVGGLTLFQRAVLTLQRAGISQIWILAGEEEKRLRAMVHADNRVQAALRWLPTREFPPTDPQTWEVLAAEVKGSCLIIGCHTVFSSPLIQSLRMEGADGRVLVVVGKMGEENNAGNPTVAYREDPQPGALGSIVVFHDQNDSDLIPSRSPTNQLPVAGDLVVLPSRLLGVSGILKSHEANPIRLALEQAAIEGIIQPISSSPTEFRDVRGPNGPQLAERSLFQSLQNLKGGWDGWFDRYVNRKLSGVLTRLFLKMGVSPNTITLISMLIGLAAAGCIATGLYEWGVMGALLFQLSVIMDCCDGEVARLTFSESRFGKEFDILADNVVHIAIFVGIASGTYLHGPWAGTSLPLILGMMTVVANGCSFWLVHRALHLRSLPQGWRQLTKAEQSKIEFILGNIANRDFSVIVLLAACFDVLGWFLWVVAIGIWLFVVTMGWGLRRVILSRA